MECLSSNLLIWYPIEVIEYSDNKYVNVYELSLSLSKITHLGGPYLFLAEFFEFFQGR